MATSWLIREDLTELRKLVEERIAGVPLPEGVRLKALEFREDTTGDPSMYVTFFVSTQLALTDERVRCLNAFSNAVMENIFDLRSGRFPYVHFNEE